MSNPFDDVYNMLWTMVEAWPDINNLVKLGNRVKFDSIAAIQPKSVVATGDLPELVLAPTNVEGNFQSTSSSTMLTREYEWIISTGSMSLSDRISPVEWMLFITMLQWKTSLTALQFSGNSFVKNLRLVSADQGLSDTDLNRGIKGWSAIWRISIEMHFKTTDLLAILTP